MENVDRSAKVADRLGVTIEALSRLRYAADQNGASALALDDALGKMNQQLGEAAGGSKTAAQAFEDLHLRVADLIKLTPERAFTAIAEKIAAIENPAQRASAAVAIFGRGGQDMIGVLKLGTKGLADFGAESDRVGATIGGKFVGLMQSARDSMDRARAAMQNLSRIAASVAAPAIQFAAETVTELLIKFQQLNPRTAIAATSFIAVGYTVGATGIVVVSKLVDAFVKLSAALKATARGQVVLQALTGAKGIAALAVSLGAAAAGLYTLNRAFKSAEKAANSTTVATSGIASAVASISSMPTIEDVLGDAVKAAKSGQAQSISEVIGALTVEHETLGLSEEALVRYKLAAVGADEAT
jgi:hypothetical protein